MRTLTRRRQQSGFTFLGVIIVLAIIGILGAEYFGTDTPGGKPFMMSTTDRTRDVVASMNFNTARTQWFAQTGGERMDINRQRSELAKLSQSYGSGGRFFLVNDRELRVTTMIDTPKFRTAFPEPAVR